MSDLPPYNKGVHSHAEEIVENIRETQSFVSGMSAQQFFGDRRAYKATMKNLELIGEAIEQLPAEACDRFPHVPWLEMIEFKCKSIRSWTGLDKHLIWTTIQDELPPMLEAAMIIAKESSAVGQNYNNE